MNEQELIELRCFFKTIIDNQEIMMSQLDDMNTALAGTQNDFAAFATAVSTVVSQLQSEITALQGGGTDLTQPLATVSALDSAIKTAIAALPQVQTPPPAPAAKPA